MRILAIWDNEAECDLVSMYLGIDDNEVTSVPGLEHVESRLKEGGEFDIIDSIDWAKLPLRIGQVRTGRMIKLS